jgi:hypothetical protein
MCVCMCACRESGDLGGKAQSRRIKEARAGWSPLAVGREKNELRVFQQRWIWRRVFQLLHWTNRKVSEIYYFHTATHYTCQSIMFYVWKSTKNSVSTIWKIFIYNFWLILSAIFDKKCLDTYGISYICICTSECLLYRVKTDIDKQVRIVLRNI